MVFQHRGISRIDSRRDESRGAPRSAARQAPIGEADLNLRFGEAGRLQIIAQGGDDRTDFALRRSGDGLQLEFTGDVGVLVNAQPAEPGTRLYSGDRIAVAGSAEEAQLITVNSDGP